VIDEIQEIPAALRKLRYSYEERSDIKVIAAGSLLEAVIEKAKFSVPVGRVEYFNLGPMTFTEFLMPEAVKKYIVTGDKEQVRGIHKDLYRTFLDDIPKYSSNKLSQNIAEVFEKIPGQIGADKVLFKGLANTNSEVIRNCIDLLQKAGLVYRVSYSGCSGLPIKASSDSSVCKLFYLDIGIYNSVMGLLGVTFFN